MPYAHITKIKYVKEHSNADKLLIGSCFGNQVIVSLDTKEGQLGVYFATDSKLSEEYCKENDLVRRKDEDGNQAGGFLDPEKRNIKALRLRKEISDGLFMPIDSLAAFTDVSKLKEGDCVDVIDGKLICEKYVPRSNKTGGNGNGSGKQKKKVEKLIDFPLFSEHIDTKQFAYNKANFHPGDLVTISLKMHGCFRSVQKVKLWGQDRSVMIKDIKTGDVVVGMNEDGKYIPSVVKNKFINGTSKDWLTIKVERKGFLGEKLSVIKCTPNHEFYISSKKAYVAASELKEGQKVSIIKDSLILTKNQKSILLGLAMGDGYYSERGEHKKSAKVEFSHKLEHEELVKYTLKCMGNICREWTGVYKSGYGSQILRASTKELTSIKNYLGTHLNTDLSGNRLNESVLEEFDEIALAFLYMGDGSLSHNEKQEDRANIAICSFNDSDSEIVKRCIDKLGFDVRLHKDSEGYNRIRFNKDDADKLFRMIAKYVPDVVRYKLSKKYRDVNKEDISTNSEFGYEEIETEITSIEKVVAKTGHEKHDIETETGNYVVGNSLVHNSSGRTTNSIKVEKTEPTLLNKILMAARLKPKSTRSYEYISGTRRVVLDDYSRGYYGNDEFRKQYHDNFVGKLEKGVSVFYEIVGYTTTGRTIMSICDNKKTNDKEFIKKYGKETVFDYGCAPGESDMYVYRMNMTNEDGDVVEYPTWLCQKRCEEMGVKHVPVLDRFLFTTIEDLEERVNELCEGEDPIGKTHIREGVVIRIENRVNFAAYKHKSFNFKVLEGIIKESATEPDMEESQDVPEDDSLE